MFKIVVTAIIAGGHFFKAVAFVCADDAEAMEKAKQLAIDHNVELWQLDRKVATFSKSK